ncbi:helix-turn-helix domain-containing protein [Nocardia higoensis]|uniref:helix-turn-helix domain-containing protein n=1 Tax=Nocardia higoensis TaxID=228599 RepID=UPI000594C2B4|nr:helix-turn-helix domain-containing protein [Nocardia higoensis]
MTRPLMTIGPERWLEILQAPERDRSTVIEVCRRYGVSRKSYYSHLARYRAEGMAGLAPRSCRPKTSPGRSSSELEAAVVRLRRERPRWGARRIRAELLRDGWDPVPALSTVHAILRRHGLIAERGEGADPQERERVSRAAATVRRVNTHRVNSQGTISYRKRKIQIGAQLAGETVRTVEAGGTVRVYRGHDLVRELVLGPAGTYHGNGRKPSGRPPRTQSA